jgi:hypothetical protein
MTDPSKADYTTLNVAIRREIPAWRSPQADGAVDRQVAAFVADAASVRFLPTLAASATVKAAFAICGLKQGAGVFDGH